uniref:Ig-like domain-containing protein n=1 Tax=Neogobius melanostomus TaxID=47308 RepID=A0A8C6S690_9GOBI
MAPNGTLRLAAALPTDRGVYRCVASNSAGAASSSVRIHVSSLPPVIQQLKEETVALSAGMPVYAHCSARGAPTPALRWKIPSGIYMRPSQFLHGNLFVLPNGTLHIRSFRTKDAGSYECTASNAVGADRRVVRIEIGGRATNGVVVQLGTTAKLPCQAVGDPTPSVTWLSPMNRIIPWSSGSGFYTERVVVVSGGTLEVRIAQKQDTGHYTCRASNSAGTRSKVVRLEVEVPNAIRNTVPSGTLNRPIAGIGTHEMNCCPHAQTTAQPQ